MAGVRTFAVCSFGMFQRHFRKVRGGSFETRVRALNFSPKTDLWSGLQKIILCLGFLIWKVRIMRVTGWIQGVTNCRMFGM